MLRILIIEGADKVGKSYFIDKLQTVLMGINVHVVSDLKQDLIFTKWLRDYIGNGNIKELNPLSQAILFGVAGNNNLHFDLQRIAEELEVGNREDEKHLFILDRSAISSVIYTLANHISEQIKITDQDLINPDNSDSLNLFDMDKINLMIEQPHIKRTLDFIRELRNKELSFKTRSGKVAYCPGLLFIKTELTGVQLQRLKGSSDYYEDEQKQIIVSLLFKNYIHNHRARALNNLVPKYGCEFNNLLLQKLNNKNLVTDVVVDNCFSTHTGDEFSLICAMQKYGTNTLECVADVAEVLNSENFWDDKLLGL
ncbi:hypothetical protein CKF54_00820 [Psittacicella hinzii]|uniref:Uncharacterized protein n=1 Tax=Psittacicella hinzii TaxID=2028575 RepID=A0A3A1Y9F6_9GAMM|nr:hypothetical protein [Psittacicella hinzii]RIY34315.1 hypothetical protein CKF54_00820 [Psittacicella hinzii]